MDIREVLEGFISIYYQKGEASYLGFLLRTLKHLPYFEPDHFFQQIQSLNQKYQARFTFFVLGKVASSRRKILLALEEQGHEIASHSYHHYSSLSLLDSQFEKEMTNSLDALSFLKKRPQGYRAPHLFFKEGHYDILKKLGFSYSSSQFGKESRPREVRNNLFEVPVHFMDCHYLGFPEKMNLSFEEVAKTGSVHAFHPYIALHPFYQKPLFAVLEKQNLPLIPIQEQLQGNSGISITFDIGF